MTKHHEDDENLVDFLRQHQPQIPPTSPELEEKIFQQISQYQENKTNNQRKNTIAAPHFQRRFLYCFPQILAAVTIIFIFSYHLLILKQPREVEVAKIEAFMENNWQGAFSEQPEDTSFLSD